MKPQGDVPRVGRLGLILISMSLVGCWNSRDGLRADWGKPFSRGNETAKSRDRATSDSLDPADDVFLGERTSAVAANGKRKSDPDRGRPSPVDDDPLLTEASGKESLRPRNAPISDEEPARGSGSGSSLEKTAEYKKIRSRLEAIKATWSSERLSGGGGYSIRCEVPHPTDPELAQVFEAKSPDEMTALNAAVVQAEKWRSSVRRRFDPEEAKADPFSP